MIGVELRAVDYFEKYVELTRRAVCAEHDAAIERGMADRWQHLAENYDEIRGALRNAPDTPDGHREFYEECSRIIFPDQFPAD